MPKVHVQEDGYEYRVKKIFSELRREYAEEESNESFEDWLNHNLKTVGTKFLDDVESYMGIPESE